MALLERFPAEFLEVFAMFTVYNYTGIHGKTLQGVSRVLPRGFTPSVIPGVTSHGIPRVASR